MQLGLLNAKINYQKPIVSLSEIAAEIVDTLVNANKIDQVQNFQKKLTVNGNSEMIYTFNLRNLYGNYLNHQVLVMDYLDKIINKIIPELQNQQLAYKTYTTNFMTNSARKSEINPNDFFIE